MTEETFQGFSNQLTMWMYYHLNKSEVLRSSCEELAQKYQNKYELADEIEGFFVNLVKETQANTKNTYVNLLSVSLQTINWLEIAEHFLAG